MSTITPGRSFLSRSFAKRDASDNLDAQYPNGPLGLTTLSEPVSQAIVDLVFVHGLGGGSRSTWTKSSDPSLFWPQEWLRMDAAFRDVRVHSFGYNSNWEKESVLNTHDFARALLGSLIDCPTIPRNSTAPLVLIGHSMGGLVIKKAYILAQQFPEFESIATRTHSIVFLATPHRGSDLATLLSRILHVAHGARPFVLDLHRNSMATQSINDEFSHHCQKLQLFSFYETLPTNYGVGKGLVVDKDLAMLGFPNERTAYMHANHRNICKYADQKDPNYQTMRNALASIIDGVRSQASLPQYNINAGQLALLDHFLDISDAIEDDLIAVDSRRMSGSCEWLAEKKSFREWRDGSGEAEIYWISAKPASGKTILSGYLVNYLRELDEDCGFYFFDSGDKANATVSALLRSMAWQMAVKHPEVLIIVLEISKKVDELAKADFRTIWRKLFLEGIMKLSFERPQYFVIDALDECNGDVELVPLLLKLSATLKIRFAITCRSKHDSYSYTMFSKTMVISEEISADDTLSDISKYLDANTESLPTIDGGGHQSTVAKILEKSAGCFLWVKLVLEELRQVNTSAEVNQVLEEVPSDMDELYTRILNTMSKAPYGQALTKAILTWTVCSARPLTTEELYFGLQLDIKDNINRIEKSITASCGQLVYIDARSRVNMVHQTARDFLLRPGLASDFSIDKKLGHKRLLMTCLQYLCSTEMTGPKNRKLTAANIGRPRCAFVAYACRALHEHIRHISSTDDELFVALIQFLNSSNILSWIEYLARAPDLARIIKTGRSLQNYLQRRSKCVSPFGKDVVVLDSWATDLVRLVAKFGKHLSASPTSIFHLIPPFCPSESAPRKQFGASARGIIVVGLSASSWDDCLSTIIRQGEQLTAVACCDKYFVIGTSKGKLVVYSELTCQELLDVDHGEPVRMLQFGETSRVMASSGIKRICLWDVDSWQQLWQQEISRDCLSLCFADEDRLLLGALRNNQLMIWDCADGHLRDSADWTEDGEDQRSNNYRRPISAAMCVELSLLAVVYRGQDILIWDIESNSLYDMYAKETGAQRTSTVRTSFVTGGLVFSSDPSVALLAASYSDGDLVLFDITEGIVKEKTLANAQLLASSPNGRTLAAADSMGRIQIYDFETLRLLHCIGADGYGIKSLVFSICNTHLLDIRGSECRVWDPTALLRPDELDENSDTVSVYSQPQETMLEADETLPLITALACDRKGDFFFCGKSDGGIYLYDTSQGSEDHRLISHARNVSITSIFFDAPSAILSSVDSSSRVMCHKLNLQDALREGMIIGTDPPLFDYRVGVAVEQILSNKGATKLLVRSTNKDVLYSIILDGKGTFTSTEMVEPRMHRWSNHPTSPDQIVLTSMEGTHLYEWETLRKLTISDSTPAESTRLSHFSNPLLVQSAQGHCLAATISDSLTSQTRSKKILLWDLSALSHKIASSKSPPSSRILTNGVQALIGAHEQKLLFLNSNGWVCSIDLEPSRLEDPTYHFFVPTDWLNAAAELIIDVTRNGDVIFVKRHEVAIIKHGLETSKQGSNAASRSPRSPIRARRPMLSKPSSSRSDDMFLKPLSDRQRSTPSVWTGDASDDVF